MLTKTTVGSCIFCNLTSEPLLTTKYSVAFRDKFPVTEGHVLIIPKGHKKDFFELSIEERFDIFENLSQSKKWLEKQYPEITGFNIGMNCGESAGQTIFHCHVHLIPRRDGDCEKPKGGVRGVISSKQSY